MRISLPGLNPRVTWLAIVAALFFTVAGLSAQFGHPLKGQWSGQWGPPTAQKRLLLDLQWDGKAITGSINPGDENATVKNVTFDYSDPTKWKVTLEAEGKDPSGKPLKIVANGTLENIGAYYKVFHGTWTEGTQKGDFTVTRN
jgi:hypothetical protein